MQNREFQDALRTWFRSNKHKLTSAPLFGKLRWSELEDETLTPPLYKAALDLKSDSLLATFSVWANGDISIIMMDNTTGLELLIDDRHLDRAQELELVLDHYCHQIVSGGPFTKYEPH